jgi:hypothetical protein
VDDPFRGVLPAMATLCLISIQNVLLYSFRIGELYYIVCYKSIYLRGHYGRDRMQSVSKSTNVVSSNPAHDEVYSIQY